MAGEFKDQARLKVLLVTEGYGASGFGVARVVDALLQNILDSGAEAKVVAPAVERNGATESEEAVVELPCWGWTRTLRFHPGQARALAEIIDTFQPDVVHVHGALVPLQRTAVLCAVKKRISVILSVHGMLEPWLWKQRGALYYGVKRLYWNVLMKPALGQVAYVHAITHQEADTLAKEFPRVPQILIPNAVDLAEYASPQSAPDADRYILFLGRLHPIKGIDLLIAAFAAVGNRSCRLLIAGPDDSVQYTDHLKAMVRQAGMDDRVSFVGGVFGAAKSALLAKAWLVVVPSYSEVVAMVNLEAAASYTPTITTTMTGLQDWGESGGLLIEPDAAQLTEALDRALSWSLEERMARGSQSRRFVAERYSWDVVGQRWMVAYQKVASGARA